MKWKMKKIIFAVCFMLIGIVSIIGYGVYKYQSGNYSSQIAKDDKPLFKNLEDLQFSFNTYFKGANIEFRLKSKEIEIDKKYNYYKEKLQNNLTITAAINKNDDSVNNIGAIGLSDNSENINKNLEEFFSIVIKVATPINQESLDYILEEVDYKNIKSKPVGTEKSIIKNGFKYTLVKNFQEGKVYSLMMVINKV